MTNEESQEPELEPEQEPEPPNLRWIMRTYRNALIYISFVATAQLLLAIAQH